MGKKSGRVSIELVSLVLAAIAEVEGWDAPHLSIMSREDGSWVMINGLPMPSAELVSAILRREPPQRVAKTAPRVM